VNTFKWIALILGLYILGGCGEGLVEVTNESYEKKIVIEGYLIPHNPVEKIYISSNFRINKNLNSGTLIPEPSYTKVTIIEHRSGNRFPLSFHYADDNLFENYYWHYTGNDLAIEYGETYSIEVEARINGETLYASAETTVPEKGLKVNTVNEQVMAYREEDDNGGVKDFQLTFDRSPGTDFYVVTVSAFDAQLDNFIFDNPFADMDRDDVEDDLDDFKFELFWIQDTPVYSGSSQVDIYWFNLWFYSEYEVIVFAADHNYKEFLMTYNDVQEQDGNFHEPIFNIEGDGIGVFGSVIADTTIIEVKR